MNSIIFIRGLLYERLNTVSISSRSIIECFYLTLFIFFLFVEWIAFLHKAYIVSTFAFIFNIDLALKGCAANNAIFLLSRKHLFSFWPLARFFKKLSKLIRDCFIQLRVFSDAAELKNLLLSSFFQESRRV
jgi:hypothetical protein